jgi:putative membrane protein
MSLLNETDKQLIAETINRIERHTDAELVTVLAPRADNYAYISVLWAAILALVVPGLLNYYGGWWNAITLVYVQWAVFIVLTLVFRIPAVTMRLVPKSVRYWRAANLARRQFLEQNLHHTDEDTGLLIFVAEAERYVEIMADRGICRHLSPDVWEPIVQNFTQKVRQGQTRQGFIDCIEACGALLKIHVPATHERNELPNHLVVLE